MFTYLHGLLRNKEKRKQFIVTIEIYISVELKVMLQAYIKTLVFQANDVGI